MERTLERLGERWLPEDEHNDVDKAQCHVIKERNF